MFYLLPIFLPNLRLDHSVLGLGAVLLSKRVRLGFLGLGLRLKAAPVTNAIITPENE